jgi:hypothetical protein
MQKFIWIGLGVLLGLLVIRYMHIDVQNGREELRDSLTGEPIATLSLSSLTIT